MTGPESPVLVVGGGPVGLALALELDHHGIAVTLVEPRSTVGHARPRAKTTSARTMEHFRRWGISGQLRSAAPIPVSWSDRVTFVSTLAGSEITHIDGCLGLRTPPEISPETAQQVSQGIVEEVLRSAVLQRSRITTRFGWRAVDVDQQADAATITIIDDGGRVERLRALWVVGADGPRSVVRSAMRSHYEGASGGRPNVNITFRSADLAAAIPHPRSIHYWVLDRAFPGVVGPLDLDGTWWAISTGTESIGSTAEAARIVRGLLGVDVDVEIIATDPWQARLLLADRYRDRRLFIVGDAAHQNPPWGGHGFNTGVGDAVNLGWKLAAVIDGWAPDALLDSYGDERRPVEAQTIELARTNMQSLSIDLGPDVDPETIRLAKEPEFHADGLVFGYGYTPDARRQTPTLAEYIPILAPGNRLPHAFIDGRPIIDVLGGEFSVLGATEDVEPLLQAAASLGIPLEHIDRSGPVVLVRPDQHIAWVGDTVVDPSAILASALNGFRAPGEPRRAADQ